jgi:hypothetical protein
MRDRLQRTAGQAKREPRNDDRRAPMQDMGRAEHAEAFQEADRIFADEVLPGVEAFREAMETRRKVSVTAYPDHVEGPQIVVQIPREDGRLTATLHVDVTPEGIRPSWEVQSTGRVNTRWIDKIRGGAGALTQESVLAKLTEIATTDFS